MSPLLAASPLSVMGYVTNCLVIEVENPSYVARGKQPSEHSCLEHL